MNTTRDDMFETMCQLIEEMREVGESNEALYAHEVELLFHLERVLDRETADLEDKLGETAL